MSRDETIVVDGPRVAAQILCRLPRDTRARLVESIRVINPQSAVQIESIIVSSLAVSVERSVSQPRFQKSALTSQTLKSKESSSSIVNVPDTKLQELLRDVSPQELAASLANAPRDAQEKVFSNISSTKQREVIDELRELPQVQASSHSSEVNGAKLNKNVDDVYSDDTPTPQQPTRRLRSRLA